ncbi:MAG: hypothetical protein ABF648_05675 [Propionibacterium sp.]
MGTALDVDGQPNCGFGLGADFIEFDRCEGETIPLQEGESDESAHSTVQTARMQCRVHVGGTTGGLAIPRCLRRGKEVIDIVHDERPFPQRCPQLTSALFL